MTTPPLPLPAEAVDAAARQLPSVDRSLIRLALAAAAPHLAAAEREHSEARHMAYLADLSREYDGNLQASVAAEREATVTAMYAGAAKAVENAVAAERERCARQLIRQGWATAAGLLRQSGGARVAEDVQSNDC